MTDTRGDVQVTENDFSKNFNAFLQMQNQYMDMWKTAGQKSPEPPTQSPWPDEVNTFWSTLLGQNNSSSPFSNPLSGNTNQQNQLMSQLAKCFEAIVNATDNKDEDTPDQWQALIDQALNDLQSQLTGMNGAPFNPTPDILNFWSGPLSFWQQSMQPHVFSDPAQAAGSTESPGPGLGPNREKYEKLKKLQEALNQYQEVQKEFSETFSTFWPDIIEQLKIKINNVSDDEELASIQSLYNLWIDCAEDIYAKKTKTDTYQKNHSKLVNASMVVKKASDDLQEETLAALNIPSRKEIDTLSERLQKTRRENRLLRSELDELRTAFANSQKGSTKTSKKKTTKKKSSKKKASRKIPK